MHDGYDWVLDENQQPRLVTREIMPEIKSLDDEIEELREHELSNKIRDLLSTWMAGYARGLVNECADEVETLENENAALKEYATHKPGCYENSELCICGLDALLKKQGDA